MSIDLGGKCALVTGGASGIGDAVVALFESLGATVCVADLAGVEPGRAKPNAIRGDVSLPSDARRMTDEAVERMGGLDVLVNCAGIADTYTPTLEQQHGSCSASSTRSDCTYLMLPSAAPTGRAPRRSIVNSADRRTRRFPPRNAYGASKGLIMLTRSLARRMGDSLE